MQTKVCTKCRKEQQVSDYSKNQNNADGLHAWCKNCTRAYQKARRAELKAKNLCKQCQKPAYKWFLCKDHFKSQRAATNKVLKVRYYSSLQLGLCICKDQVVPGETRCKACKDLHYTARKTKEASWKAAGMCMVCGDVRYETSTYYCLKHLMIKRRRDILRSVGQRVVCDDKPKLHKRLIEIQTTEICHWCEKSTSPDLRTIDHVVPLAHNMARALDPDNLVMACRTCNDSKGDKLPGDWSPRSKEAA